MCALNENFNKDTKWDTESLNTLIDRVIEIYNKEASSCPLKETLDSINWEQVAFDSFSGEECRQKIDLLTNNVRQHTTFGDIFEELFSNVENIVKKLKMYQNFHKLYPTNDFSSICVDLCTKKPLQSPIIQPKIPPRPRRIYIDKKTKKFKSHVNRGSLCNYYSKKFTRLPVAEKYSYVVQYEQKMRFYEENLKEFKKLYPETPQKSISLTSLKEEQKIVSEYFKVPQPPPQNGYFLYHRERCHDDWKTIFDSWSKLSAKEKKLYEENALKLKNIYESELQEKMSLMGEFDRSLMELYLKRRRKAVNDVGDESMIALLEFVSERYPSGINDITDKAKTKIVEDFMNT